jgi:hypothetical protein
MTLVSSYICHVATSSLTTLPDLFFDPATKATVQKGAQANTFPFGDSGSGQVDTAPAPSSEEPETATTSAVVEETSGATGTCAPASTVTVTVGASTETAVASTTSSAAEADPSTGSKIEGALDFGSCTDPGVEFVRHIPFVPLHTIS